MRSMNDQELEKLRVLVAGGSGIIEHLMGDYKRLHWSFEDTWTSRNIPRALQVKQFIEEHGGTVIDDQSHIIPARFGKRPYDVYIGIILFHVGLCAKGEQDDKRR